MAQRMEACAVGAPRHPLGVVVELLRAGDGHGLGAVVRRQEPRGGAVAWPVGPECSQETGRQQRVTVRPPLALMDADEPAVTFDVGALPPHDFPAAQARGIGRHEQHAMSGGGGARDQALEFGDTHQVWQQPLSRAGGPVEVEPIPAEGRDREELEPTSHLVAGTPGQAACDE